MPSRKTLFALSLFAASALAAAPARAAGTEVVGSRFTLTFPEGWQLFPIGASDTVKVLMNAQTSSVCYVAAVMTDHPVTAQEIEMYRQMYGQGDSVTKVSDGTKTLGGKSFTYIEYKSADAADSSLVRFFYTSSGNLLFQAFVGYDAENAAATVADVEAALATLVLTGTPIRAWAARVPTSLRRPDRDVMGRFRIAEARTALFRLPAR